MKQHYHNDYLSSRDNRVSKCQTAEGVTLMEDLRRFWTFSLPADDNWKNIPVLIVTVEEVEPGEEGATVEIAPLD